MPLSAGWHQARLLSAAPTGRDGRASITSTPISPATGPVTHHRCFSAEKYQTQGISSSSLEERDEWANGRLRR